MPLGPGPAPGLNWLSLCIACFVVIRGALCLYLVWAVLKALFSAVRRAISTVISAASLSAVAKAFTMNSSLMIFLFSVVGGTAGMPIRIATAALMDPMRVRAAALAYFLVPWGS